MLRTMFATRVGGGAIHPTTDAKDERCHDCPQPRSEHLDRPSVLEAALVLLDADPDRLSMRSLAASMGVGVSSLYRHVSGRDDVINGVMELVWDGLADEVDWTLDPADELLVEIMVASVRLWSRHPRLGIHLGAPALDTPQSRNTLAVMAATFRAAGFSPDALADVSFAVTSMTTGHIMVASSRHLAEERLGRGADAPPPLDPSSLEDPDERSIARAMATSSDLIRFERAARALLDGLRTT